MDIQESHSSADNPRETVYAYDPETVTVLQPIKWAFSHPLTKTKNYLVSLFPFAQWIYRYNLTWLVGDLIAGITVGIVVVPQSMSYAQIAGLPVQYGLYASFIGVSLYCFFATSKDVTIGPVAVMSAEVYSIVHRVLERMPHLTEKDAPIIATTLALLCGGITAGIGFLRLGFILEYIAMPCVLGFMTGSAFTILVGQVPNLLGLSKLFNTHGASYLIVINSLKNLKHCTLDAAFGLVCLFILFALKYSFEYLSRRDPRRKRIYFFLNTLRTAIVIIVSTVISWAVCRHHVKSKKFPIKILKTVPSGLKEVGAPPVNVDIVRQLGPELPIATVILLLEHIAIAKSFGRINNYRIDPNQELIAIGATNLIGYFFKAYPATGSFSRSAIKAKAGVRTPLAGIFTAGCVLIAIFCLTKAFFWISQAALAAIIIHAVCDLISSWQSTWSFWRISPVECVIYLVDIFLCVFVTIESGIYFSVASSLVLLLLRVSFPSGQFLGKVEFYKVNDPHLILPGTSSASKYQRDQSPGAESLHNSRQNSRLEILTSEDPQKTAIEKQRSHDKEAAVDVTSSSRAGSLQIVQEHSPIPAPGKGVKWVSLAHRGVNPDVEVIPPPPGVFVFRFNDSVLYPNVSYQLDHLVTYIKQNCRRDLDESHVEKLGDRPWNDHGPRKRKPIPGHIDSRPFLRAVVLDFSCSPHIDLTSVSTLWDVRQELNKYANRDVEFHFVGVLSKWTRRALVNGGFGGSNKDRPPVTQVSAAKIEYLDAEAQFPAKDQQSHGTDLAAIVPTSTPYFHLDMPDLA